MDSWNGAHKACRNCYFYQPQGHRGGECQRLRVTVQSHWAACPLGCPVFAESWTPSRMASAEVVRPLQAALAMTPDLLPTAQAGNPPQRDVSNDSIAA